MIQEAQLSKAISKWITYVKKTSINTPKSSLRCTRKNLTWIQQIKFSRKTLFCRLSKGLKEVKKVQQYLESLSPCIAGIASLSLQKLSLMWSRLFRSRALWCARLSVEPPPRLLQKSRSSRWIACDVISSLFSTQIYRLFQRIGDGLKVCSEKSL